MERAPSTGKKLVVKTHAVDPDVYERFVAIAKREHRSASLAVRLLIAEHVREHEAELEAA